jgi:hypothetical protein
MEAKSSHRKSRRSDGPITTPLECFRRGQDSVPMRNALAELAMRLVDAEDRGEFQKADGVTAIGSSAQNQLCAEILLTKPQRTFISGSLGENSGRASDNGLQLEQITSLWSHVRLGRMWRACWRAIPANEGCVAGGKSSRSTTRSSSHVRHPRHDCCAFGVSLVACSRSGRTLSCKHGF